MVPPLDKMVLDKNSLMGFVVGPFLLWGMARGLKLATAFAAGLLSLRRES